MYHLCDESAFRHKLNFGKFTKSDFHALVNGFNRLWFFIDIKLIDIDLKRGWVNSIAYFHCLEKSPAINCFASTCDCNATNGLKHKTDWAYERVLAYQYAHKYTSLARVYE